MDDNIGIKTGKQQDTEALIRLGAQFSPTGWAEHPRRSRISEAGPRNIAADPVAARPGMAR